MISLAQELLMECLSHKHSPRATCQRKCSQKATPRNQCHHTSCLLHYFLISFRYYSSTITTTIHTSLIIIDWMRLRTILQSAAALSPTFNNNRQKNSQNSANKTNFSRSVTAISRKVCPTADLFHKQTNRLNF